jgi:hypothetical protein
MQTGGQLGCKRLVKLGAISHFFIEMLRKQYPAYRSQGRHCEWWGFALTPNQPVILTLVCGADEK